MMGLLLQDAVVPEKTSTSSTDATDLALINLECRWQKVIAGTAKSAHHDAERI